MSTTLTLPDGRTLHIDVTGPEGGIPLLHHHGTPGSRRQAPALQRAAHAQGLRFVTYDRAGYAGSTRKPGRTVIDVAGDMTAILDHLGAERALTSGWSGGGPHALATAAALPHRIAGALVICGVAPFDAEGLDFLDGMGQDNLEEFRAALAGEPELRLFLEAAAPGLAAATPEQIIEEMASLLPEVDRATLDDEFGGFLADSFADALSTGVDGWLDDDIAFTRPWGFDLGAISVPTTLWQGAEDLMVPADHGRWLVAHVPEMRGHVLPGEGHLSVAVGKSDEMIGELTSFL